MVLGQRSFFETRIVFQGNCSGQEAVIFLAPRQELSPEGMYSYRKADKMTVTRITRLITIYADKTDTLLSQLCYYLCYVNAIASFVTFNLSSDHVRAVSSRDFDKWTIVSCSGFASIYCKHCYILSSDS